VDESKVSAGSWRLRGVARAQLNTSTCFADPSGRIGVAMFSTAATTAVPVPATRVVRRSSPSRPDPEINNLRCGKFTQLNTDRCRPSPATRIPTNSS
jgi:hypothetical protein